MIMTNDLYSINKSVVLSLQDKIDEINSDGSYEYEYIPIKNLENEQIEEFINTSKINCDYIIYLGQYPKFDNCELFLIHVKLDQFAQIHKFYYVYVVEGFRSWVSVSITPDNCHSANYMNLNIKLRGFFDICHLFATEFLYYFNTNSLQSFMYIPKNVKKVDCNYIKETNITISMDEETIKPEEIMKPSENAEWTKLATAAGGKYTLIMRKGNDDMIIICNCPDFFFREKNKDRCRHIEKFLHISDEVPEGELFPRGVDATVDGKEFVVRYRIDNEFDVFKR